MSSTVGVYISTTFLEYSDKNALPSRFSNSTFQWRLSQGNNKEAYENVCETELFTKVRHRRGNEDRKQSKNNHQDPNENSLKQEIMAHRDRGKQKLLLYITNYFKYMDLKKA